MLLLTWSISCSGRAGKRVDDTVKSTSAPVEELVKLIRMVSPDENTGFKLNDQVKVILEANNKNKLPDSVLVYFDSKFVTSLKNEPWEYLIPSGFTVTTGRKSLKVTSYRDGKAQNTITRFMIVYSDGAPKKYGYKVIHTYPHSRDAFTQGLVYDKGVTFEGTGQETGSSLREVELETGKVLRQHNLDASLIWRRDALSRQDLPGHMAK